MKKLLTVVVSAALIASTAPSAIAHTTANSTNNSRQVVSNEDLTSIKGGCVRNDHWTSKTQRRSEVFRKAANSPCKDLNAWWGTQTNTPDVMVQGMYFKRRKFVPGSRGFQSIMSGAYFPGTGYYTVLLSDVNPRVKMKGQILDDPRYIDQDVYYMH